MPSKSNDKQALQVDLGHHWVGLEGTDTICLTLDPLPKRKRSLQEVRFCCCYCFSVLLIVTTRLGLSGPRAGPRANPLLEISSELLCLLR